MELIQELKKIIVELTVETGLPVSEVFQIAVQVQRNRILEDSLKENKPQEETTSKRTWNTYD
jgi:hypothetical protein